MVVVVTCSHVYYKDKGLRLFIKKFMRKVITLHVQQHYKIVYRGKSPIDCCNEFQSLIVLLLDLVYEFVWCLNNFIELTSCSIRIRRSKQF